ncbi:hypothetical protein OG735_41375 (plasmid) [Streptomyces sp. NBC_01210]|uniref:hypothetical protein n=1 Tax=Streptomyces sp. NBC_01210 TaxID=2903774 RepID=UPI002E112DD6|nr:hypothetical protein OG735_41375 [Streptomyces sp. NBC_01210]
MATQPGTQAVSQQTSYKRGDFVLYRNAELFWAGKPGHTFVCRVDRTWESGVFDLVCLDTGRVVCDAHPDFMRLLPTADVMHDIDTAPLSEPDSGAMTPAAVAWLRQHLAQDSSTLPAPR